MSQRWLIPRPCLLQLLSLESQRNLVGKLSTFMFNASPRHGARGDAWYKSSYILASSCQKTDIIDLAKECKIV